MFGMSVFQSVLERLKAEDESGGSMAPEPAAPVGVRGFSSGFVTEIPRTATDRRRVDNAYHDTSSDEMLAPPAPVEKPAMPHHLTRTLPRDVAADLAIGEAETPATLAAKRRLFAARNHPDRHPADFRANATLRMKIANMIIDEALRRLAAVRRP